MPSLPGLVAASPLDDTVSAHESDRRLVALGALFKAPWSRSLHSSSTPQRDVLLSRSLIGVSMTPDGISERMFV